MLRKRWAAFSVSEKTGIVAVAVLILTSVLVPTVRYVEPPVSTYIKTHLPGSSSPSVVNGGSREPKKLGTFSVAVLSGPSCSVPGASAAAGQVTATSGGALCPVDLLVINKWNRLSDPNVQL